MTEIDSRMTCEVQGNRLLLCSAIAAAVEVGGQGSRRQGLKSATMMRMEDNKTRDALALVSGDFSKGGVLIRFCPACGSSVVTTFGDAANG